MASAAVADTRLVTTIAFASLSSSNLPMRAASQLVMIPVATEIYLVNKKKLRAAVSNLRKVVKGDRLYKASSSF